MSESLTLAVEEVVCPACGPAPTTLWMDDGKPTRYVRCRLCRTVFASPRASRSVRYAWLDTRFQAGGNAFQYATSRQAAFARIAAILQARTADGRVLDIGCDTGEFFEFFPPPLWERYGVELSPSAAHYASATYHAQVFAGTIGEAAFPQQHFDLVTMLDMLYHVEDPCADLQKIACLLRPEGYVGIELAGQEYQLMRSRGLLSLLIDHQWTRLYTDSAYLFWFSPIGLQRLLNRCGFDVVGWHTIGSPKRTNQLLQLAASAYASTMSWFVQHSMRTITLAPKYLCIARLKNA